MAKKIKNGQKNKKVERSIPHSIPESHVEFGCHVSLAFFTLNQFFSLTWSFIILSFFKSASRCFCM